jgi:hypothetical protein
MFRLREYIFYQFILYLSVLTYTYLYLKLYSSILFYSSTILLPFSSSHIPLPLLLYYTLLFFLSFIFQSNPPFLLFILWSIISLPNIHSILVGTYIYLFIFYQYLPGQSDPARSIGVEGRGRDWEWLRCDVFYVLTPHVLSEWMVEVCGAYLCGV